MKNFSLLILLFSLLLVSCATRAPEVAPQAQVEPVVEEEPETAETQDEEPWYWINTARAVGLTDEEFAAFLISLGVTPETEEAEEEPVSEEIAEVVAEEEPSEESEAVLLVGELEEVEESPAGTDAISKIEPTEVNESEEPSAEIRTYEAEEEPEIELPELEFKFVGEDYRSLSLIFEEEMSIVETPSFTAVTIVDNTVPEETVSADVITALAIEYKELEKIDFAKPSFKSRVVTFLKEHILFIELGVLAILAAVIAIIFVKRGKKVRAQAQEVPVIDEGEEIVLIPRYYVSPNAALERSNAMPETSETDLENSREEKPESEPKAEHKAKYKAKYWPEYSYEESNYELEDESGYDSMDDSEYEEDPGGHKYSFKF